MLQFVLTIFFLIIIEFSALRNVIPPPPPDIPPELLDTSESLRSSEADIAEYVEVPEQATAKELRRKFDPHPDRKTALIYEIKMGKNLRKVVRVKFRKCDVFRVGFTV